MTFQRSQLGKFGEQEAADFLKCRGYAILEQNFKTKVGELDIIAREGDYVCFIEVRTKTTDWHGHPFESISMRKRHKLIQTALWYLQQKRLDDAKVRFDVVAIISEEKENPRIELLKNAFEVEG